MSKEETLTPMQRELLDRADIIFASIKDAAIVAKDFALEHLPDVAQQLILLERVHLTVLFLLPFILLSLLIVGVRHVDKVTRESGFDVIVQILTLVCGASLVVSVISMLVTFRDFLTVWFAPKIYLIEYITALIKKTV